jgi:hypothetical protein
MSFRFPLAREADPSQIDERATETRFPHVDHGTNKMKSELSAAVSLIVLLAPSFGHEPLLSFLHHVPELRDLSLKMSEDQLKSHIRTHRLYAKRELSHGRVSYHVIAPEGENVFVGFASGKCTGIQRMQPIPRQLIKEHIGTSEYRAWMAERKAEPRRPATPEDSGTHVRKQ